MLNRDICESHVAEAWKGCDVEQAALGLPHIENAIRQLECPAGGQLANRRGGDRFRHAGDPHHRVIRKGGDVIDVLPTVASLKHDGPIVHDPQQTGFDRVGVHEIDHRLVERRQPGLRYAADRQGLGRELGNADQRNDHRDQLNAG